VPRLPRGKGLSLTGPAVFKIAVFAALLVAVIVLQRPCADAAGKFVGQFDEKAQAPVDAATVEKFPPGNYVELNGNMTDEEIKKAMEEADRKARESAPKQPTPSAPQ
jgi:hypothetical protein